MCDLRPYMQYFVARTINTASRECSCRSGCPPSGILNSEDHAKTMAQKLSTLKIAQLTTEAVPMPMSIMRLDLATPMSAATITAADVRQAIKDGILLPPSVRLALYYKDEDGDFVGLPRSETVWPTCCIFENVLKAWYICLPEAPATSPSAPALPAAQATTPSTPASSAASATIPSTPARGCLGPHLHQPDKKKIRELDIPGYEGYSLLAATSDGCASCVKHWLDKGVDPNFQSSSERYTALDCLWWEAKKGRIDPSIAEQLKEMLKDAGGLANKVVDKM